jgi:hypothetical protein
VEDEEEEGGGISMKERMKAGEVEKESSSLGSSHLAVSSVSSSVVGVNNPVLDVTPVGTLEKKQKSEKAYVETEGL